MKLSINQAASRGIKKLRYNCCTDTCHLVLDTVGKQVMVIYLYCTGNKLKGNIDPLVIYPSKIDMDRENYWRYDDDTDTIQDKIMESELKASIE